MNKIRAVIYIFVLAALVAVAAEAKPKPPQPPSGVQSQASVCAQSPAPPATTNYIYPRVPLQGFFQWNNMLGYCGEVSMMEAAMNNGEYYSQYNSRLLCGTSWGQSGPPASSNAYCSQYKNSADYNAQVLDEDPNTGVTGGTVYSWAHQCAQNARLADTRYPYVIGGQLISQQMPASECWGSGASPACPGYQNFMSWIKQQTILGNEVSVAILDGGGSDNEYDHEVNVTRIGTNHSVTDPTYYPDDVLYFEQHGSNVSGTSPGTGAPDGAGVANSKGPPCTTYEWGATFASLGATRAQANAKGHASFYIILPAPETIQEGTGEATGQGTVAIPGPNNFAESVTGPMDTYNETVPVWLNGQAPDTGSVYGPIVDNAKSPPLTLNPDLSAAPLNGWTVVAGYEYELPEAGTCTNSPPVWMNIVLQATVGGLTPGVSYNLYEYQFGSAPTSGPNQGSLGGNGTWAGASQPALAVPITAFNANSAPGGSTPYNTLTTFTASGSTYTANTLATTSDQIVVYRAVPTDPGLYSPVNGSTLLGPSVTFAWDSATAGPDAGATAYSLDVGKEQGGNEYYQSGSLSNTIFSQTVNSLPADGSTVWARWYYYANGQSCQYNPCWQHNDYSYTASNGTNPTGSVLVTPAPGSTLTGSSATFTWTAGTGVTANALDVGSTSHGNNYYQSGILSSPEGNPTSLIATGLPIFGGTVYVTLWSQVDGQWLSNEYTYNPAGGGGSAAVMTSPTPNGSTLGSSEDGGSQTFTWSAGTGATAYWLDIGTGLGGNQYYQSGNLGLVQTVTVNGLPTNGNQIFVTLYSLIDGSWLSNAYNYYTFNATTGLAVMQSPTPGSTLHGPQATFSWSSDANATGYWVDVSALAPGGNDLDQSGNLGLAQSYTVYNLPGYNTTIYVTLYSLVGGQWLSNSYTYVSD